MTLYDHNHFLFIWWCIYLFENVWNIYRHYVFILASNTPVISIACVAAVGLTAVELITSSFGIHFLWTLSSVQCLAYTITALFLWEHIFFIVCFVNFIRFFLMFLFFIIFVYWYVAIIILWCVMIVLIILRILIWCVTIILISLRILIWYFTIILINYMILIIFFIRYLK